MFFDYCKAFDSVPHHPLFVVDGESSDTTQVLSGVPQGSVLGLLLFLIYIDGVTTATASRISKNTLFVDDLLLYRPMSCPNDIVSIQENVEAIEKWSNDNYLTLNPEKC